MLSRVKPATPATHSPTFSPTRAEAHNLNTQLHHCKFFFLPVLASIWQEVTQNSSNIHHLIISILTLIFQTVKTSHFSLSVLAEAAVSIVIQRHNVCWTEFYRQCVTLTLFARSMDLSQTLNCCEVHDKQKTSRDFNKSWLSLHPMHEHYSSPAHSFSYTNILYLGGELLLLNY